MYLDFTILGLIAFFVVDFIVAIDEIILLVEDKLKGNGVNSKGKHMEGPHIDQRQKA